MPRLRVRDASILSPSCGPRPAAPALDTDASARIGRRLRTELRIRLCHSPCRIRGVGATLLVRGTAHPVDTLVELPAIRAGGRPRAVAVFELVTPDADRDALTARLRAFDLVPSLQHVVRIDLAARQVLVHSRHASLRLCPTDVATVREPDALIDLDALDMVIPWRCLFGTHAQFPAPS